MGIQKAIRHRITWLRQRKQLQVLHRVLWVFLVLFLVWGVYRLLSPFPVWVEELVLKGVVFGGVTFWGVSRERRLTIRGLGLRGSQLFRGVLAGVGLGLLLGLAASWRFLLQDGMAQAMYSIEGVRGVLLLALVTAFWEQLVFAGYMTQALAVAFDEWQVMLVVGALFAAIHIPSLLVAQVAFLSMVATLLLLICVGAGCSLLMLRSKRLLAPIMTQTVWGLAVYLFR